MLQDNGGKTRDLKRMQHGTEKNLTKLLSPISINNSQNFKNIFPSTKNASLEWVREVFHLKIHIFRKI